MNSVEKYDFGLKSGSERLALSESPIAGILSPGTKPNRPDPYNHGRVAKDLTQSLASVRSSKPSSHNIVDFTGINNGLFDDNLNSNKTSNNLFAMPYDPLIMRTQTLAAPVAIVPVDLNVVNESSKHSSHKKQKKEKKKHKNKDKDREKSGKSKEGKEHKRDKKEKKKSKDKDKERKHKHRSSSNSNTTIEAPLKLKITQNKVTSTPEGRK